MLRMRTDASTERVQLRVVSNKVTSTVSHSFGTGGGTQLPELGKMRCKLCGAAGALTSILESHGSRLLSCQECGVGFVDPLPDPVSAVRHFQNDYITDDVHLEKIYGTSRKAALKLIAGVVHRHKKRGRILDVGCAGGFFLHRYFDSKAWEKYGVEPSRYALRRAAARQISTYEGEVGSVDLPEASFDVITIAGVLPYFRTPKQELRVLKRALRPDGIIVIELPLGLTQVWRHTTRLGQMTGGGGRSVLDSPHIFFYGPNSLRLLFSEAGFSTESLVPAPGNDQPSFAQQFLFRLYYRASQFVSFASAEQLMFGPGVVAAISPAAQ
jgi:SAM-dependent methyltransferase